MTEDIFIVGYGLTPECRCPAVVEASSADDALMMVRNQSRNGGPWHFAQPRLVQAGDRETIETTAILRSGILTHIQGVACSRTVPTIKTAFHGETTHA